MSSKAKGDRNEREACSVYERVGYTTYRAPNQFGSGDILASDDFGGFDVLAIPPGGSTAKARLCQVKSNVAAGVESWSGEALQVASATVAPEMLVRFDGHGGPHPTPARWRLIRPTGTATPPYRTVVDERDDGTPGDGWGVVEWLSDATGLEVDDGE